MKRLGFFCLVLCLGLTGGAQELYVFSEPASNMPAASFASRVAANFGTGDSKGRRYTAEALFGISRKFMLHAGTTVSNMHSPGTRWESAFVYGKYRFLSLDEVHRHFRMAAFAEGAYSRNRYRYDEVSLQGDRSGVQLGLIATQLLNKLAVSGTVSHTQSFDATRKLADAQQRSFQSLNYSASAGYLLLPGNYTGYRQLNLNLYLELLGQRTLDRSSHYFDLAPAVQLIFNSSSKLNIGYRFQVKGNQLRGMYTGFLVSFEHTFFSALRRTSR